MTLEHAISETVQKPWGRRDLRPWSNLHAEGSPIGEIWFQRADRHAPEPALLLKLLFTTERLSIQVHPGDAQAQAKGLLNGKTEAWYILDARAGGEVALGLKRPLTTEALRASIDDGSIADVIAWRHVERGAAVSVPAGTIHAIGAGLVIAEIQQRSDATYRIFDYGRRRPLHVEDAVAAANASPFPRSVGPRALTDVRSLLVENPYFVFERFDLPPKSKWRIETDRETWVLVLRGRAKIGPMAASVGEAYFLDDDNVALDVGPEKFTALVAYAGSEIKAGLLVDLSRGAGHPPASEPRPVAPLPSFANAPSIPSKATS